MPRLFSRSRLITVNDVPVKKSFFGFEYRVTATFLLAAPKGQSNELLDKTYKGVGII
jgi:hypothetical protein